MKKMALILLLLFSNIAYSQWEPMNKGLYGGAILGLLVMDDAILAGSYGGIYRSTNGGETWSLTGARDFSFETFLKVDDRIYAGGFNGIYISDDNGASWTASTKLPHNIVSLAASDGVIYAGSWGNGGDGVYRSTDNGNNWTAVNNGLKSDLIKSLLIVGDTVFAGTSKGVFKSTDKGDNWNFATVETYDNPNVTDFATTTGKIFAAVGSDLIVSTDNGGTWKKQSVGSPNKIFKCLLTRGEEIFAYKMDGLFYSGDGGENWTHKSEVLTEEVNDIAYQGVNIYLATADNGILLSFDNGVTWAVSNTGISNIRISNIAAKGESMVLNRNNDQIYYSTDSGANWNRSVTDVTNEQSFTFFQDKLYVATLFSGIFVSSDNGVAWSECNEGIDNLSILSLAKNSDTLYAGGESLYRTTDGITWTKIDFNEGASSILPINDRIYLSTYDNSSFYVSSDGGISWQKKMDGIFYYFINALSNLESQIIAGTETGIYISSDGGETWENRTNGLTNSTTLALGIIDNNIIAGTRGGLIISKDAGITWQNKTGDLPDSLIYSIQILGQYLYVGTSNSGLYRAKLSELGIIGVNDPISENDFKLYPNPASEFLNVSIENMEPGSIVRVYDMLGNIVLISTLDGSNAKNLDISSLPAGAYYVRIGSLGQTLIKN